MSTPAAPVIKFDNAEYKEPAKKDIEGETCFLMEWFRERLPLEYNGGSSLTRDRKAEPKAERVLIFADDYGFCPSTKSGERGLEFWTPPDRVKQTKVVETHPSELTEKAMIAAVGSTQWDIIVWGYSCQNAPKGCTDPNEIIKLQEDVQRLLLALSQHLQKKPILCNRLCIATAGAMGIEAIEHQHWGLGIITHANMVGFTNAIRIELGESLRVHYVDCPHLPDKMDHDLCSEVYREEGFGTNVVRLNPKGPLENPTQLGSVEGRFVQRMMTSHIYRTRACRWSLPTKAGGVILITGGNGSLGLILGRWLCDMAERSAYNHDLKIIFLSRSAKISPDNEKTWKDVQARAQRVGITVEQAKWDISTFEAAKELIAKHTPNIVGVIHSAGVLRDSMLMNQTWEKYQEVYASKSHAALYLHCALEEFKNPSLYFFWLFSSIAVHGSMGQSNYGASNAMLDGIARHRRAIGLPGTSIQWGAWGEAGMAASLDAANKKRMASGPMPPVSNRDMLDGLEKGLSTDMPTFACFKYNTQVIIDSVDVEPKGAVMQFNQNQVQKIAPPAHLDQ